MAKKKPSASSPVPASSPAKKSGPAKKSVHSLLKHPHNPDGEVVTGKDPKGVTVTICVDKNGKKESVYVKKGSFTSHPFPGYNSKTKDLFDHLCRYEGFADPVAQFGNVQAVKNNGKIIVTNISTGDSKSFDPDAKSGLISKEAREYINIQINSFSRKKAA